MPNKAAVAFSATVAAALALGGCGGGTAETRTVNRMVTKEQELQDLQRALQFGAISQAEYEQERRKALTR